MAERDILNFDVAIVGAGPAGVAAACRLGQLARESGREMSICVLEKGAEVGAHSLSGALLDPIALIELFPDWDKRDPPPMTQVSQEEVHFFAGESKGLKIPAWMVPKPLHNQGCYVISLGRLCQWLARQAESLGVEIFPGFAAAEVHYDAAGKVAGVITGDVGLDREGNPKDNFQPGVLIEAKYTLFAEGCRGHLGKELVERFKLGWGNDGKSGSKNEDERSQCDPPHYGLGFKELWRIDPAKFHPGKILHTWGWPLDAHTEGGGFLYHWHDNLVSVGFVVGLGYENTYLNPYQEFQRWKTHPRIRSLLEGAERLGYGARALNKGGWQSIPRTVFPGGLLIGCEAGFLDNARLKGIHTAIQTGMLAAEAVAGALAANRQNDEVSEFETRWRNSWVANTLYRTRNFGPALNRWGAYLGGMYSWVEQNILAGKVPWTLHNKTPDYARLKPAAESEKKTYPSANGKVSFDILSSVYLSNTNHREDQPCHLKLKDPAIPVEKCLPLYDEPAQRYCPANVYEIVQEPEGPRFQINFQNCVHCKACDIKDPFQNIIWTPPEGGDGPRYVNL